MNITFKTLTDNLPEELVYIISKMRHRSLMEKMKKSIYSWNVWKKPSDKLIRLIGGTGTVQFGHYENIFLEVSKDHGYISANAISPFLEHTIFMFQPYHYNATIVKDDKNLAHCTHWDWNMVERQEDYDEDYDEDYYDNFRQDYYDNFRQDYYDNYYDNFNNL